MRYTAELAARAAAWLARDGQSTGPDGKRSAEGLLELATVWAAIQNVPLPACIRQCQYSERARDVAAYVREFSQLSSSPAAMSDTQATSNYQIAPQYAGQSFVHEDYNGVVTADNLTDEAAEFFIGKGRSDAFIKRDVTATEGDSAPADQPTQSTTDKPVVSQADLEAEQAAHATTAGKFEKEHAAHGKTKEALASEKEAHGKTKADLKESQSQIKDLTKQLEKLTKAVEKAADKVADATLTDEPAS